MADSEQERLMSELTARLQNSTGIDLSKQPFETIGDMQAAAEATYGRKQEIGTSFPSIGRGSVMHGRFLTSEEDQIQENFIKRIIDEFDKNNAPAR